MARRASVCAAKLRAGSDGLRSAVGNHDGLFDIGLTWPSSTFALPVGSIVAMADVALLDGRRLIALGAPRSHPAA